MSKFVWGEQKEILLTENNNLPNVDIMVDYYEQFLVANDSHRILFEKLNSHILVVACKDLLVSVPTPTPTSIY